MKKAPQNGKPAFAGICHSSSGQSYHYKLWCAMSYLPTARSTTSTKAAASETAAKSTSETAAAAATPKTTG